MTAPVANPIVMAFHLLFSFEPIPKSTAKINGVFLEKDSQTQVNSVYGWMTFLRLTASLLALLARE